MKNLILVTILFMSIVSFGQDNLISVSVSERAEMKPDFYKVQICLSEKVKVDPEIQLTESITIDMVLESLLEKMKTEDLDMDDLTLETISESSTSNVINGYQNYNQNYTASKKKLLKRTYVLNWHRDLDKLEEFLTGLRFNGFEFAAVTASYKAETIKATRKKLMTTALKLAKENAQLMAAEFGKELGELHAVSQTDLYASGQVWYAEDYPNYNYNNVYNMNNTQSISTKSTSLISKFETVSLSVSFKIKE